MEQQPFHVVVHKHQFKLGEEYKIASLWRDLTGLTICSRPKTWHTDAMWQVVAMLRFWAPNPSVCYAFQGIRVGWNESIHERLWLRLVLGLQEKAAKWAKRQAHKKPHFYWESGAFHKDAEGYLSRYYDTPRAVTHRWYVTRWEWEGSGTQCF